MEFGKRTAQALAVIGTLASPAAAQESADTHLVLQQTGAEYPLAREMQIIEDTQARALATCNAAFQSRVSELQTVIDSSGIKDRAALIAIIEDMGAPEGGMDERPDQVLMQAAGSMVVTNKAICNRDASAEAVDSLKALNQVLAENIASLRAETASLQDILIILEALEGFATGNAPVLQEIAVLRLEASQLSAQADASAANADESATNADASAAKADEYARRVEAIWNRIENDV